MHALPPPPAAAYGFRNAELGMTQAQWRTSAPWRGAATCTARDPATTVCTSSQQPLGNAFHVHELTSTFREGRLASISYTTSIDGFADAVAELRHAYGDPDKITRDQVTLEGGLVRQRVAMQWRKGGSTIRLIDPVGMGGRLRVTIARGDERIQLEPKS